jgi:hypothetical protein
VGLEISGKEFLDTFQDAWADWEQIPLKDSYAQEFIAGAKDLGYVVDIVTYAPGTQLENKSKWLHKNLNSGTSAVDISDSFTLINSSEHKRWKYYMDYDVFVDDCPHIAVGAKRLGKIGILYSQPWNAGVHDGLISRRVDNLEQALFYLKTKERGMYVY